MNIKIKNECIDYSINNKNIEIGGFICYDITGRIFFIKSNNISNNKEIIFKIDLKEYINIKNKYLIYGIFHSHTHDSVDFSELDKKTAELFGLPIYIYNPNKNIWKEYIPNNLIHKTTGNPFIWGLFDCFSVIRFYFFKKGIFLEDYDRDENFIKGNFKQDIKKLALDAGFLIVDEKEKDGDLILMKNYRNAPQHLGIYENGKFLSHRYGAISNYENINNNYFLNKLAILRYNKCNN